MAISDIIDTAALLVSALAMVAAFITIFCSNKANRNIQSITLRLDFSHRYQEIMLAMPDSKDADKIEKYVLLYFDLCSEEYRLWKSDDGIVDDTTWQLWKEGMKDLMDTHPEYRKIWEDNKSNYRSISDQGPDTFYNFFDTQICS